MGRAGRDTTLRWSSMTRLLVVGAMVAALLVGVAGLPSARAASYSDSVKALGPGAYWPLESWASYGGCGSSCSSPDVVGSSENAIRQGATTIGQSGAILTSPSTDSVRLQPATPTDGHLVFNIDPLINPDVLSLELWFKTASSFTGPGNLFTNGTVHAGGYVTLQIDSSGHLVGVAQYRDGLGFRADATVTGPVVTDNAWHHAVIVAGTGGVSLFADGAQAGTAGAPKPIFTWGEETAWIGSGEQANSSVGGGGFDGWVDELVAYDRPVSLTEERTSFAASGRTPPPLVLNDGPLSPQLIQAGSSRSISAPVCNKTGKPVTCPTGEFWHTWNDFTISGRGTGLNLSHSYSTNQAAVNGPLGYGFTFSYNMRVEDPGTDWVTVHEEANTELVFHLDSGVFVAPAYVQATLVKNMDGSWTFTRRGTTTFSFNSTGQLTRIEDPNGYHTDLAYSSGRLATVTDSASRALTFTWDTTNNRITEVSDPATTPRTVEFSYNTDGTMSDYTDVAGGNWHFTYDTAHRMLTMRDPRHTSDGKVTENHYDNSGRVDWQKDELLRQTTFDYTTVPGSVITADPAGNATLDEFADNVVISVTRGYGTAVAATWSYEYDADEATITEVTDPNSHTTSAEYDSAGNITSQTDGLANETTATFNSFNEPLTITDRNGVTTTFAYDSDGNLESVSTPLVGSSPAVARETTFDYAD
jgi:YD repeat-containing protein